MIRAKQISAVEVMRATLARAEKVQAACNCFITLCAERALARCGGRRPGDRQRRRARAAARRAVPRQGPGQHRGRAHDVCLLHPRAQRAEGGLRLGRPAEAGRRHPDRQDHDARVRAHALHGGAAVRPHAQRLGGGPHQRRLLGRRRASRSPPASARSASAPMPAARRASPPPATASSASSSRPAWCRTTWRPRCSPTSPASIPMARTVMDMRADAGGDGRQAPQRSLFLRRAGSGFVAAAQAGRVASRACASPGGRCSATR